MNRLKIILLTLATLLILLAYYSWPTQYPNWSELTHGNNTPPNFEQVFAADKVQRIDLVIESSDWDAMWQDLADNLGQNNRGGEMGERGERMGERGGEGGAGGRMGEVTFTPLYVACQVKYEGSVWERVGVRFKGNSSLMRTFSEGGKKLSMKLDFDRFESEYPELKNQRFYGFKKLNLNSNYNDKSFVCERVYTDMLREFGLAAAQTSFCEVYIDHGKGAQYYGLYTLIEQVDDSVIDTQFEKSGGNVYKPEERAGSFAEGTFDTEQFYKKSGKKGDYDDVEALYTLLHSPQRTSDQAAWCQQLESIFDVEVFLKWLAATTTMQNWDTYGNMAHNYYLYNNPSTKQLTWIAWDHNEAFKSEHNNIYEVHELALAGDQWPLISYLIAVDEYHAKYLEYLRRFNDEIFVGSKLAAIYDGYYELLKGSVYREVSARTSLSYYKEFDQSIATLKSQVASRNAVVASYLNDPRAMEQTATRQSGEGRGGMMPGGMMPEGGRMGGERMMGRGGRMGMEGGERPEMMERGERPEMMMGRGEQRPPMGAMGMRGEVVEGEPLPMEGDSLMMMRGARR